MRKIYCYGNTDFDGDEVAHTLAKKYFDFHDKFKFILSNSPNDVLISEGEVVIMDVVKGIRDVQILTSIDDLKLCHSLSCHDLDLAFYLKLMKEVGKINDVKIIGLPFGNKDYNYLKTEVEKILEKI